MLELVGEIDGMICGDDAITPAVIDKALPRLRVISKYGIGLDKIDVDYVTEKGIPLTFCPGVNHTTVAEHTFTLLLSLYKNLVPQANDCAQGMWNRSTGHEIFGKRILILEYGQNWQRSSHSCQHSGCRYPVTTAVGTTPSQGLIKSPGLPILNPPCPIPILSAYTSPLPRVPTT